MKEHILMLSESTSLLCLIAIFVLLFVIIQKSLKYSSLFSGATSAIVAVCVSLLSVIGLMRTFAVAGGVKTPAADGGKSGSVLDIILIPYVALALAILLTLILLFLSKFLRSSEIGRRSEKAERPPKTEKITKKQNEERLTK